MGLPSAGATIATVKYPHRDAQQLHLNIQLFGADNLSGEGKSTLADLIADIQTAVSSKLRPVAVVARASSSMKNGLVVTNAHVVGSSSSVSCLADRWARA